MREVPLGELCGLLPALGHAIGGVRGASTPCQLLQAPGQPRGCPRGSGAFRFTPAESKQSKPSVWEAPAFLPSHVKLQILAYF